MADSLKPALTLDGLVKDLQPVPFYKRPFFILSLWMGFALIYMGLIIKFLLGQTLSKFFSLDFPSALMATLLILLFLSSSFIVIRDSVPGWSKQKFTKYMPLLLMLVWVLLLLTFYPAKQDTAPRSFGMPHDEDFFCAKYLLMIGVLPAFVLWGLTRILAPTKLRRVGALLLISASTGGALCLEFFCGNESPVHRIYGHWGMVFIVGVLGFLSGRRLLKW